MALPSEVKLELKKGANKMAIPLIIAGVKIAAPIAARYLAGKISRQAAIKASKELAKKPAKSILQKGKEFYKENIKGKPYQTEGKNKIEKIKSVANKKNIGPNTKEFIKDAVKWEVGLEAVDKAYPEYKKGGVVKKCRMDGIALRGKTRAKERSK